MRLAGVCSPARPASYDSQVALILPSSTRLHSMLPAAGDPTYPRAIRLLDNLDENVEPSLSCALMTAPNISHGFFLAD